jgi:hypothetical protein
MCGSDEKIVFKAIKPNLKIKTFFGTNANAVIIQNLDGVIFGYYVLIGQQNG